MERTWNIQLRYATGQVVNVLVKTKPTYCFSIKPEGPHFQLLMTLLKGGEQIEILKIVYHEVDKAA